jgi:hypothetical protein
MSNVALHSFSDQVTRQVLREVYRVLQPGGLLLLHLNSEADMPYRAQRYQRVEVLEPGYYREAHGQTMHFFSEAYCREVLSEWALLDLTHVPLQVGDGRTFKCVWRCVARKPLPPGYVPPE